MPECHLRLKVEAQGPRPIIYSILGRFEPPRSLAFIILKANLSTGLVGVVGGSPLVFGPPLAANSGAGVGWRDASSRCPTSGPAERATDGGTECPRNDSTD